MQKITSKLPNLNALIAFEAAGRLNSFTKAAAELCLTQGAISHQIKKLEQSLDVRLFQRVHKKISLTREGSHYLKIASQAIYQIAEATHELRSRSAPNRLVIASSDAICFHWLMPRMAELRGFEPGVELQIVSFQDNPVGHNREFDLGIQYGGANRTGYHYEFLAEGQLIPVCSPGYLHNRQKFTDPKQLKTERLLELEHDMRSPCSWRHWFDSLGVKGPFPKPFLRLSNYLIMNKATFEGQGIALGRRYLIEDHITNNWFEVAYPAALKAKEDFMMVIPTSKTLNRQQRNIRDWIMESFSSTPAPF